MYAQCTSIYRSLSHLLYDETYCFFLRWKPPVTDQAEYEKIIEDNQLDLIGGLEIFLNLERVSISL